MLFRNLERLLQTKKRENHSCRSGTFKVEACNFTNIRACFPRFLNCTNGTKSRRVSQISRISPDYNNR